ncbi:MAG: 4-hydroxy-tetrahydrodipicolinate synthase [Cyanobacteria bacterium P01_C01_bin.89]
MIDFGRVMTAMITPFSDSGAVAYDVVEKLADYLVTHGTDTVLVCGTTGESPTLTWEEEFELFKVVKQTVGSRGRVIAGTGSNSTREAITATQHAAELGLDGTLQVVPYYNKPPQEGLRAHFRAIAASVSDLPIILYNIPGRTGQNMTPETVAALAEVPNIVGVKAASGSLDQVSQMRRLTPPDFDIYSGDDSLTLPMLSVGAKGVISVASHLVGDALQAMIQAFEQGKSQEAIAIHQRLLPLFKVLFLTTNPIPVKAALELKGWSVGSSRLPLTSCPEPIREKVRETLDALEPN